MASFVVSKSTPTTAEVDVLAVPVYDDLTGGPGTKEVERALGTTIAALAEDLPLLNLTHKQFKGKLGQAILATTFGKLPAKHVLFIGLGAKKDVDRATIRKAGGATARRAGGG